MSRRIGKWDLPVIVVVSLMAIGLLSYLVKGFSSNPAGFIIPIVVLGGIYLLYKYPPSGLRSSNTKGRKGEPEVIQGKQQTSAKRRTARPASKTVPFRVIDGGKDDDQLPKYH